ncbi:hypothetical protein HU200_016129 [Digitaria exilis]|uniref:Uncharacterized protein n=1 Tax=Digitaria exilis TaxID=1010633 RepID=A0A835KJ54_9POAL|nr:hypothetical protein HU200_016129 [Digitaria exilis]
MNRRFVNLVLGDYDTRMHSLFRLDVAKHLFYPSTAQAEAANSKQETNNGGGGGGDNKPRKPSRLKWPKTPRIKWLGQLPELTIFPPADNGDEKLDPWRPLPSYDDDDAFMLLHPSTSEGTILHVSREGRAVIYDADAHAFSATTVPSFDAGVGREPIVFSVPGAGGGEEKESLYVMCSTSNSRKHYYDRHRCYYSSPPNNNDDEDEEDHRCSGDFFVLDFNNQPLKWQHLPRPPFVVDKGRSAGSQSCIRSSAVVDGGRTIVVSSDERNGDFGGEFTYCFDTATRQWRHDGDWALPFVGRAEYAPGLGTWIGFSSTPPQHHLCAADLSLSAMDDANRAPTPRHVWEVFTPPAYEESEVVLNRHHPSYVLRRSTEWCPTGGNLVSLEAPVGFAPSRCSTFAGESASVSMNPTWTCLKRRSSRCSPELRWYAATAGKKRGSGW